MKQSNRNHERPSVPLILLQTKSKLNRSSFDPDKVTSHGRKHAERKDSEEESSTEEKSDRANIRGKWNSNHRRKNRRGENSSESQGSTEESDSSESNSSDRSNNRHQKRRERNSRGGKRKRDKHSSSSSSESDDDSGEDEFRDYLENLSEKEKNYREIRYVLEHYHTDDYCKKLYEWNRDKYLTWKRKLEAKKEILRQEKNLKEDKLLRICNISKNSDQRENQIRNCLRDCLSTNNRFIFMINVVINKPETTTINAGNILHN